MALVEDRSHVAWQTVMKFLDRQLVRGNQQYVVLAVKYSPANHSLERS